MLAEHKCNLVPSPTFTWLGYDFDLNKKSISVTMSRWAKAGLMFNQLLVSKSPSCRSRAQAIGCIVSMHSVLGHSGTRSLRSLMHGAVPPDNRSFHFHAPLATEEKLEVAEWAAKLEGEPPSESLIIYNFIPDIVMFTDASEKGLGAIAYIAEEKLTEYADIPSFAIGESSTMRELLAVELGVTSFANHLIMKNVTCKLDSQSAVQILIKGSVKPHLNNIAKRILKLLALSKATISFEWVPRAENVEADEASRILDIDDWEVRENIFVFLTRKWGEPLIDLFASVHTSKCNLFIGKVWSGDTRQVGVNAFNRENWHHWKSFAWIVPPPHLLWHALNLLRSVKGKAIVGAPNWSAYLPCQGLKATNGEWIPEILDGIRYPAGSRLFESRPGVAHVFSDQFSRTDFVFFLVNFSADKGAKKSLNF